jgi:tetratricopeptide (TPR) repeat protein
VLSKLAEAKAYYHIKIRPEALVSSYLTAIQEAKANISIEIMKLEKIIPLETFITIGKYLNYSGYYIEAINVLLYGCSIYNSASLCFLLGLSYYRLDRIDEAEECFIEGNLLDNRNVDIWSYLTMICISRGIHRLTEAESCLYQVLRLKQQNTTILRELAISFMSIDKLQIAEDLIRKAMVLEIAFNPNQKPNSSTRKLLADILVGQNMAAKALEEYKQLLLDDTIDWNSKLDIANKCSQLLISLGREEEIQSLRNIMENIKLENDMMYSKGGGGGRSNDEYGEENSSNNHAVRFE